MRFETRFIQLKKGFTKVLTDNYLRKMYWLDEIHVFKDADGYFNGRIIGINKTGKLMVELEEQTASILRKLNSLNDLLIFFKKYLNLSKLLVFLQTLLKTI